MILGIALLLGGYSVLYWGIHHIPGADCPDADPNSCRYSLWELLGVPKSWNYPVRGPIQFGSSGLGFGGVSTQPQQSTNATTSSPLSSGGSWQTSILSGIGAPSSQNNLSKLSAWNACEGNLSGQSGLGINNPFNTTLNCCGGSSVNSAGVQSYPSLAAGVQATVQTLQAARYSAVVSNLVNDGSGQAFALAVGSSGWGTSGTCIAQSLNSGVTG